METFWNIFWPIFWIMIFCGLAGIFFYIVKILKDVSTVVHTAANVSEQIQAISDLVEDVRMKANMGIFVDVLEISKRLFSKFRKEKKSV